MRHSLRLALVAGLAIAGLAAFTAEVPPETVVLEGASHSITIRYLEDSGDYRRAQVSFQPARRGERPAWRGEARSFRLLGTGTLSRRERSRFERAGLTTTHILSSGFGSDVVMVAPSPRTLYGVDVTPMRGAIHRFVVPGMSSRGGDGDTDEPPPATPPKEDPPADPPSDPDPDPDPDPPADDEECADFWDCIPVDTPPVFENPFGYTSPPSRSGRTVSFTF